MTEVGLDQPNNSARVITLSRRRMMAIWVAIAALFLLMIMIGSVLLIMVLRPKLASTPGPNVDGKLAVTPEESWWTVLPNHYWLGRPPHQRQTSGG